MTSKDVVFVRVRPEHQPDCAYEISRVLRGKPDRVSIWCKHEKALLVERGHLLEEYEFQRIFGPSEDNAKVFESVGGEKMIKNALKGIQETVMAYGQTGSGKTHTIFGNSDSDFGLLHLFIQNLFNEIYAKQERGDEPEGSEVFVWVSCFEIFGDSLEDLVPPFGPDSRDENGEPIRFLEDKFFVKTSKVQYKRVLVRDAMSCLGMLFDACEQRKTGLSSVNSRSSRSHAVVQLVVEKRHAPSGRGTAGGVTLVDLAGSEKEHENPTADGRATARVLNTSLSTLNRLIRNLQEGKLPQSDKRQSVLNRVLYDALQTKGCGVALVFCISPMNLHTQSSVSTLMMAANCKRIECKRRPHYLFFPTPPPQPEPILLNEKKNPQEEQQEKELPGVSALSALHNAATGGLPSPPPPTAFYQYQNTQTPHATAPFSFLQKPPTQEEHLVHPSQPTRPMRHTEVQTEFPEALLTPSGHPHPSSLLPIRHGQPSMTMASDTSQQQRTALEALHSLPLSSNGASALNTLQGRFNAMQTPSAPFSFAFAERMEREGGYAEMHFREGPGRLEQRMHHAPSMGMTPRELLQMASHVNPKGDGGIYADTPYRFHSPKGMRYTNTSKAGDGEKRSGAKLSGTNAAQDGDGGQRGKGIAAERERERARGTDREGVSSWASPESGGAAATGTAEWHLAQAFALERAKNRILGAELAELRDRLSKEEPPPPRLGSLRATAPPPFMATADEDAFASRLHPQGIVLPEHADSMGGHPHAHTAPFAWRADQTGGGGGQFPLTRGPPSPPGPPQKDTISPRKARWLAAATLQAGPHGPRPMPGPRRDEEPIVPPEDFPPEGREDPFGVVMTPSAVTPSSTTARGKGKLLRSLVTQGLSPHSGKTQRSGGGRRSHAAAKGHTEGSTPGGGPWKRSVAEASYAYHLREARWLYDFLTATEEDEFALRMPPFPSRSIPHTPLQHPHSLGHALSQSAHRSLQRGGRGAWRDRDGTGRRRPWSPAEMGAEGADRTPSPPPPFSSPSASGRGGGRGETWRQQGRMTGSSGPIHSSSAALDTLSRLQMAMQEGDRADYTRDSDVRRDVHEDPRASLRGSKTGPPGVPSSSKQRLRDRLAKCVRVLQYQTEEGRQMEEEGSEGDRQNREREGGDAEGALGVLEELLRSLDDSEPEGDGGEEEQMKAQRASPQRLREGERERSPFEGKGKGPIRMVQNSPPSPPHAAVLKKATQLKKSQLREAEVEVPSSSFLSTQVAPRYAQFSPTALQGGRMSSSAPPGGRGRGRGGLLVQRSGLKGGASGASRRGLQSRMAALSKMCGGVSRRGPSFSGEKKKQRWETDSEEGEEEEELESDKSGCRRFDGVASSSSSSSSSEPSLALVARRDRENGVHPEAGGEAEAQSAERQEREGGKERGPDPPASCEKEGDGILREAASENLTEVQLKKREEESKQGEALTHRLPFRPPQALQRFVPVLEAREEEEGPVRTEQDGSREVGGECLDLLRSSHPPLGGSGLSAFAGSTGGFLGGTLGRGCPKEKGKGGGGSGLQRCRSYSALSGASHDPRFLGEDGKTIRVPPPPLSLSASRFDGIEERGVEEDFEGTAESQSVSLSLSVDVSRSLKSTLRRMRTERKGEESESEDGGASFQQSPASSSSSVSVSLSANDSLASPPIQIHRNQGLLSSTTRGRHQEGQENRGLAGMHRQRKGRGASLSLSLSTSSPSASPRSLRRRVDVSPPPPMPSPPLGPSHADANKGRLLSFPLRGSRSPAHKSPDILWDRDREKECSEVSFLSSRQSPAFQARSPSPAPLQVRRERLEDRQPRRSPSEEPNTMACLPPNGMPKESVHPAPPVSQAKLDRQSSDTSRAEQVISAPSSLPKAGGSTAAEALLAASVAVAVGACRSSALTTASSFPGDDDAE
uniref:Kinesin motor domain-containing protein n=1 Tax=Chromera velia CCMP2878 TaxID=1169474 RepID=A0A0G4FH84_9ALVE|eukprot:Cvel_16978.t1-p1 / transcript=Cvel_16978.t1 / gene=Cvel_16978 / organism=Chromera_velia_CCMP2878 / gene_product=Kinesin-related protein 13, putative / transcript_product=Kinesin-related protein 13, putative / location=Cvel_scaffold1333:18129-27385(-) / protein_length=1907 / sequence_SO=supercontig / SO=protein_coding / is_pseudo=false